MWWRTAGLVLCSIVCASTLINRGAPRPRGPVVEITTDTTLECGTRHRITSGYVHLRPDGTSHLNPQDGKETGSGSKSGSLFFSLFEGSGKAKNNGLIVQFEGGPGASGYDHPFIGAGPCQLTPGGNVTLTPAPFPWTDHANLLVLDYPVGTGWPALQSRAPSSTSAFQENATVDDGREDDDRTPRQGRLVNSSAKAAEDFDDFLQAFYSHYSQLKAQPLVISTLSYGGTYVSHIASTIMQRNGLRHTTRLTWEKRYGWVMNWIRGIRRFVKPIDAIVLGNPYADVESQIYYQWDTACNTEPVLYNSTICQHMRDELSACLDKLHYINEVETTVELRLEAQAICTRYALTHGEDLLRNMWDRREEACWPLSLCHWWQEPLVDLMNSKEMRQVLGVSSGLTYRYVGPSAMAFAMNGDAIQSAYKLLTPVLEAGTRLFVYSGLNDTAVPYAATHSWMNRLPSPHLKQFRGSDTIDVSNDFFNGTVVNPGGPYTLIGVAEAGHLVQVTHPQLTQAVIKAAVRGRSYDTLSDEGHHQAF